MIRVQLSFLGAVLAGAVLPAPAVAVAAPFQDASVRSVPAPQPMDSLGLEAYDGSAGELDVTPPRVTDPGIRVDGRLTEEAWSRAALLRGFTQFSPVEGVPATQRTEVLVLVGKDAIYFGIRAFDSDPEGIRATLAERDKVAQSDDYVWITLDTFNDQRRAYVFIVNPLGVQQDGMWAEGSRANRHQRMMFGGPIDFNPDFIWESYGVVEEWGYVVEVRIPFKSLRFPRLPVQDWGLNVVRRIQRTGYRESWAPLTREVTNQLAQAGRLRGLEGLDPGLFLELNPILTGKRLGAYDAAAGRLVRTDPTGEFGLNLTYGLTSNLTLDGTYNPDFSQVEADAGQISVNERFALFYPEKRPFFLEGTEIFQLPMQLVYTRSIVNPVAGAKLTGKVGNVNVGYLGAVDDVGGKKPAVNLLRLRRDLGESSTLGLTYTDRTVSGDEYNRVAAADVRLVLARRYTLEFLGAASATAEGGGRTTGTLLNARFERAGREFSLSGELQDVAPEFRARAGFIRRVGDTQLQSRVAYNWYGRPGDLVERWGPSLEVQAYWDHDDFWAGRKWNEGQVQLGGSVSFRNNIMVFGSYTRSAFAYGPGAYEGLFVLPAGGPEVPFRPDASLFEGLDGFRIFVSGNSWERFRGRLRLEWRENPIFDRRLGVPVEVANAWVADGSFTLLPTPSLSADVGVRHESLFRRRDGSRYSSATIPRIRIQYQFTRYVFLRLTTEYANQERGDLLDPETGAPLAYCTDSCSPRVGSKDHDIYVEGLLTYEPSPGTVMYVGYSRNMSDGSAFAFRNVTSRADGLFAKVSYRFRF